jgi:hypothetical protein
MTPIFWSVTFLIQDFDVSSHVSICSLIVVIDAYSVKLLFNKKRKSGFLKEIQINCISIIYAQICQLEKK